MRKKILIMGAAGRDFHNFNVLFRDKKEFQVIAFTATQIPGIENKVYPAKLAGKLYSKGIPIYSEERLCELIKKFQVQEVVFSYSDVSYQYLMNRASLVNAAGADFKLISPEKTMLKSFKPVISVCAVRTGAGKSQTSRKIIELLKAKGLKVVALRHPMPYGNLSIEAIQRFESFKDLEKNKCTIEEREEFEPYIEKGLIVFAGIDYEKILRKAEKEADIILWDGGNNDTPFIKPDLAFTVADPLRPGHELNYFPGETNARIADVLIINKEDSAKKEDIKLVESNLQKLNPKAKIIHANSPITVENPEKIKNRKVLVIEDGPTLTHGEMKFGAGSIAAKKFNCKIIDPKPFLKGSLKNTFKKYPEIGKELPAMGYFPQQLKDLQDTINSSNAEAIVIGTPINLGKLLNIKKPWTRVSYELQEKGKLNLEKVLKEFLKKVT